MSYVRVSSFEFFFNDDEGDDDNVDYRGSTSPYFMSNVPFLIKLELRYIGEVRRRWEYSKEKTLLQQEWKSTTKLD